MASQNILSKTDRALVAYLISFGAGDSENTFPAKRSSGKTLPNAVVYSQKAAEDVPFSGIYEVNVSVMCKSNGVDDDGEGAAAIAADERTALVFDAFRSNLDNASDKLAGDITTAARGVGGDLLEFTVLAVYDAGQEAGFDEESDTWVDTQNLRVICCAKDVS